MGRMLKPHVAFLAHEALLALQTSEQSVLDLAPALDAVDLEAEILLDVEALGQAEAVEHVEREFSTAHRTTRLQLLLLLVIYPETQAFGMEEIETYCRTFEEGRLVE